MEVRKVTVLGANGIMGANVSAIFASFGNCKVYMIGRNIDSLTLAKQRAIKSVRAFSIDENLIPVTYDNFEKCVLDSDLIFESLGEDFDLKYKFFEKIDKLLPNDAIVATGTSGFSIEKLSKAFSEKNKKKFLGIHFFNPPYNMPLAELIFSSKTDIHIRKFLEKYLCNILLRKIIIAKDSPAFLANRIGFYCINMAVKLAEQYANNFGGIDYIDSILCGYTGRNLSPIYTADFVGIEVYNAIINNIYANSHDYEHDVFSQPKIVEELLKQNRIGKKCNDGFYKTTKEGNNSRLFALDISTLKFAPKNNFDFPIISQLKEKIRVGDYIEAMDMLFENESQEANIASVFLLKYVIYALNMSLENSFSIHSADIAMAEGFNWVPPLAFIDLIGVDKFIKYSQEKLGKEYLQKANFERIVQEIVHSNYDYKKFMKGI